MATKPIPKLILCKGHNTPYLKCIGNRKETEYYMSRSIFAQGDKVAYCNENENAFESINQINQMIQLEKEELLVYSCFDFYAKSIQQVQQETGMNILQVMSYITHLCELGMIQESFKNQYIKIKS